MDSNEQRLINERRRRNKGDEFDPLVPARGFLDAFRKEYGLGREHWAEVRRRQRAAKGQSENAPRFTEMTESYPLGVRLAEMLGMKQEKNVKTRNDMGMGLEPLGEGRRAGQVLGAVAADITQDTSRNFYWLLNALQATGNVITESALGRANPSLFDTHYIPKEQKDYTLEKLMELKAPDRLNITDEKDKEIAVNRGYLTSADDGEETRRGVRVKPERIKKGEYNPATGRIQQATPNLSLIHISEPTRPY